MCANEPCEVVRHAPGGGAGLLRWQEQIALLILLMTKRDILEVVSLNYPRPVLSSCCCTMGTTKADVILLLLQLCFDMHLTAREEKGDAGAWKPGFRRGGRQGERKGCGWMEALSRNQKQACVSLFGLSWDPGCTKSLSCHFV